MRGFVLVTALVGCAASAAQAFTAINRLDVNPTREGFEVVARYGAGPRQIWCAAAQYARYEQGNTPATRIYIFEGYSASLTDPGLRAVRFTTRPPASGDGVRPGDGGDYSVSIRKVGYNLTIAHAESFCLDVFEDRFGLPFN